MNNGWSEYQREVLNRLERLEEASVTLDEKVTLLRIDVAQLKVKAGMWGAIAGMVPALVTAVLAFAGQL